MAKKTSASVAPKNDPTSKASKVREYKLAHPRSTKSQIAKALGVSYQTVYASLANGKKKRSKDSTSKQGSGKTVVTTSRNPLQLDTAIQVLQLANQLLKLTGSEKSAVKAVAAAKNLLA